MTFEARITVHQNRMAKPNYTEVHSRMATAGYSRILSSGGYTLSELHGMYRKASFYGTIDAEKTAIENSLRPMGFSFSIELFKIEDTRTFNLEPATNTLRSLLALSQMK